MYSSLFLEAIKGAVLSTKAVTLLEKEHKVFFLERTDHKMRIHFPVSINYKMAAEIQKIFDRILRTPLVHRGPKFVRNCPIYYDFQDKQHFAFLPKFKMVAEIQKILKFSQAIKE